MQRSEGPGEPTTETLQPVGQSVPRRDGYEKAAGTAQYAGDLEIQGMTYAKLVPSPLPHARIVSIDASKARALPGVFAVLTGAELVNMELSLIHI